MVVENEIGTFVNMVVAAVVVAVAVPLLTISIVINVVRKNKDSFVLFFAVAMLSGVVSACALGFDWDKKRDFEDPEVLAEVEETDADAEDGSETIDQEIPLSCLSYEKLCVGENGEECVDPDTDRNHCGGCGVTCSETQSCIQGVCDCSSGKSACGDECYDFLTEVLACGGCGNSCSYPNAGASCENGECQMGACLEGFFDCNGDPSDGCESDLRDLENCGSCGVVCEYSNAVASCDGGTCEFLDCEAGFDDCDDDTANGCETDLNTDAGNCGGCGTVCGEADPFLRVCLSGVCGCGCGNGKKDDQQEMIDCPSDTPYIVTCGDGFCDARNNAENVTKCSADCLAVPDCGTVSACQPDRGEDFNSCSDCGDISSVLGDGICGGVRERCNTSQDCGLCNTCGG